MYKTMLFEVEVMHESNTEKCRSNKESNNPKVLMAKNGRMMLLRKCVVCESKKSKFIKDQEPNGLLTSLGIKAPLNQIPLLGPLLF